MAEMSEQGVCHMARRTDQDQEMWGRLVGMIDWLLGSSLGQQGGYAETGQAKSRIVD